MGPGAQEVEIGWVCAFSVILGAAMFGKTTAASASGIVDLGFRGACHRAARLRAGPLAQSGLRLLNDISILSKSCKVRSLSRDKAVIRRMSVERICTMRTTHWAPTLLFCAVLAAVAPSQALAYTEDDGTQMNFSGVGDVHVCKNNEPMVGLDVAHNRFLCSKAVTVDPPATWIADTATHRTFTFNGAPVSIHVCPPGEVMMGLSIDKNVLICANGQPNPFPPQGFTTSLEVDGGATETKIKELNFSESVHGCSSTDGPPVMAGVKVDDNLLVCIVFPLAPVSSCALCNDGSCQCGNGTAAQVCAGHNGVNSSNLGCQQQP
jgi:hypothetical protein